MNVYLEITCSDCGADLGYGKLGSDPIPRCKYCGSENLTETSYYDD